MHGVIVVDAESFWSTCLRHDAYIHDHCLGYRHDYLLFYQLPNFGGNDTYGITGIPSMVGGRGVVRRASPGASTKIFYPGSGHEDA